MLRSMRISSLKSNSRKSLLKGGTGPMIGFVAVGAMSILAAGEMAENASSQTATTHLDGEWYLSKPPANSYSDHFSSATSPLAELGVDFGPTPKKVGKDEAIPIPVRPPTIQPQASFPTLHSKLLVGPHEERPFQISANEPVPIDNELFVGHVVLVLRPLSPEDDPMFRQRILEEEENSTTTFQLQLQGRFKKKIDRNRLYVGGELPGGRMNLGSLTKRVSQFVLRFLSEKIGTGMTYSFGDENGESPHISFPLCTGMENVVLSDDEFDLPRIGKEPFVEPEDSKIERRRSSDTAPQDWDTKGFYSMSYSASSIDLPTWKILFPFEMDLSRFWGNSPARLVIYADNNDGRGKEYLFNLQIKHLPQSSGAAL